MQIIVSHEAVDFDGLAAAVAAQKLYAGSEIVLGRTVSRGVRDFLALHRDRFPVLRREAVDQDRVERLIVVDAGRADRLSAFDKLLARIAARDPRLEVVIYDHHKDSGEDLGACEVHAEDVGSVTTLLVEQIRARKLSIDPVEATLFLLGIYADTGSLTYPSTQGRDAFAAAWLLDEGAHLPAVRRYLSPPLRESQRLALTRVLAELEVRRVRGVPIGIAALEGSERCDGLDEVATKALEIEPVEALFVLHSVPGRSVDCVARSRASFIDVGAIVAELGGGGHRGAAAAKLKGAALLEAKQRLEAALEAHPPAPRRVADVMSAPVQTVEVSLTLTELGARLNDWGFSGAPVCRNGRLAGVVSKRDVERAVAKNGGHLPVSSHMAQRLITAEPRTPIEDALSTMESANVGRLPVLDGERLVGIVTRSDLLRALYGDAGEGEGGA